jgi:hypothetical protein
VRVVRVAEVERNIEDLRLRARQQVDGLHEPHLLRDVLEAQAALLEPSLQGADRETERPGDALDPGKTGVRRDDRDHLAEPAEEIHRRRVSAPCLDVDVRRPVHASVR